MSAFSDTLVSQAMQGDALALEGLLRRTQPDLRRYARRFCLAADVDDAVQESLIRITQRLPQLRAAAALSGWLMTMVRRECLRLARRVWREEPSDEQLLAQLATRAEDGLRLDLARALESLPAHHLEIVLLRDFEELSLQDIAQRTGESIACIKSRLHRARTLVREYLATAA
ncbi:RNA polymerase sigma factor [Azohydromonas lata]|uniref:Sigma-70 family RNA polymerase sigma factor n=1 Tax=Azohydromonas lata TaxID=45677 RepID=A0ABU5IKC8_9BURK|nr:sigma-70 family RNA polymerase sigma factor [Azohydromonas lata]MDZ5459363.1 sigma-70 family RNA polymerase sigma factor [Azohydromonas lata]